MSKNKGGGSFRGRDSKTGQPIQIPQIKRPAAPSVPRVMPRTKASPRGAYPGAACNNHLGGH